MLLNLVRTRYLSVLIFTINKKQQHRRYHRQSKLLIKKEFFVLTTSNEEAYLTFKGAFGSFLCASKCAGIQ